MRKPLAIIILMYLFIIPCVLAMGETDVYQIQNGEDDVIMTETLALDTDGPYIILKDYDISYKIGLRFTNINISRGETITEAILSVYCKYDFPNGTGTVTIYGLKVADAPVLDDPEDLNGPLTENYVIWNISDVKGPDKWHNVTITPIIQEIVNQYGWENGNSLALIILSEKGNIRRQFTSADYMNPAKLYITITPPTPPEANYELIQTYKGYEIYNVTIGGDMIEDFTTWTEYDPNNRLSQNSTASIYENLVKGSNVEVWLNKTYGEGYFDDFQIEFYEKVTDCYSSTSTGVHLLVVSNITDSFYDLDEAEETYISVEVTYQTSGKVKARLWKVEQGTAIFGTEIQNLNVNEKYKFVLNKTDTTVTLKVYDLSNNLIGSVSHNLSEDYKWNLLMCPDSWGGYGSGYVMSGYIENLKIVGGGVSSWHIEIWYNGSQINENFTSLDDAINYIDNVLIGPEEEPYNPEVGGYEVIPRRIVKLSFLMSGLGLMMVGLIAISYKPTLVRAIMGILMIVLAMGLLIHLTQI
ncbi:MAG: hypothetical protein DRP27_02570 [Thermotogae bacterium]|nr:MAG: hypothetical protein DRP27_02570 [Thermotogota bacterium]